jgi:hypothetical protein
MKSVMGVGPYQGNTGCSYCLSGLELHVNPGSIFSPFIQWGNPHAANVQRAGYWGYGTSGDEEIEPANTYFPPCCTSDDSFTVTISGPDPYVGSYPIGRTSSACYGDTGKDYYCTYVPFPPMPSDPTNPTGLVYWLLYIQCFGTLSAFFPTQGAQCTIESLDPLIITGTMQMSNPTDPTGQTVDVPFVIS